MGVLSFCCIYFPKTFKNTSGGCLCCLEKFWENHFIAISEFWDWTFTIYKQEIGEAILTSKFVQASKCTETWQKSHRKLQTPSLLSFIKTCSQSLKTICKRVIYFEATTKFSRTTASRRFWSQISEHLLFVIFWWRSSLSNRNQSTDLHCKSIDWFLYDSGLSH